ncbi:MAG TPA: tRNA uridine-5-carboxymethylaminomethyl(34) synthesis GTPase MnmE [Dongiaceae bacterium]|nr:tRNA uridine-5-carboxymethylaminomethyl(34) synthesis GTPase MnmE [Dongiaceae bacterium]
MDTIYALASAAGRAGVAVIRISGPAAGTAVRRLTGDRPLPEPRRAVLRRFTNPDGSTELDRGLLLWFPGPQSFTGEDVAELHLHAGRAVLHAVVEALAQCEGLRPAEPGEFTRRAFENGKLDLTAAEGLADLVNAETEAQRRQALRQLDGELGQLYEDWRRRLVAALARLEAHIDFPDEELPTDLVVRTRAEVSRLLPEIAAHLDDNRRGERVRDGLAVALLGAPNVGKSSVINTLAGREAAIVSALAGTTRDVIEVHLDLAGYPVTIADTAGLRQAQDEIESEGVRRALARAEASDIKILLFDATRYPNVDPQTIRLADQNAIIAINKCDLAPLGPAVLVNGCPALAISAKTGAGMDALLSRLTAAAVESIGVATAPALTRARHRHALAEGREALARSLTASAPELLAEDLRLAVRAIGRITGRVDVEDILDVIFREFCIGK